MRRCCLLLAVFIVAVVSCSFGVTPGYETGKLVNAREATDVQVFWQFVIKVHDRVYVAEYRPLIPWNFELLAEFTINGPVQVRLSGKHIYLVRPFNKDLRLKVVMRYQIDDERQLAQFRPQQPQYTMGAGGELVPRGVPNRD